MEIELESERLGSEIMSKFPATSMLILKPKNMTLEACSKVLALRAQVAKWYPEMLVF